MQVYPGVMGTVSQQFQPYYQWGGGRQRVVSIKSRHIGREGGGYGESCLSFPVTLVRRERWRVDFNRIGVRWSAPFQPQSVRVESGNCSPTIL